MCEKVKFKPEVMGIILTVPLKSPCSVLIRMVTRKTLLTTILTSALMSLGCLLPYSSAYSITSSLGPSFEYDPFNPSTGSSSRLLTAVGATTGSPPQPWSDGGGGRSDERSFSSHSGDNNRDNNPRGEYPRGPSDPSTFEEHNQYTPTQLQVAGRILFESRVTTPKPYLGHRSFISSYRNPNYYQKKSKPNDNRYLYGSTSKNTYQSGEDEEGEQSPEYRDKPSLSASPSHHRDYPSRGGLPPPPPKISQISPPSPHSVPIRFSDTDTDSVTTPESKTAPATDCVTDRPSSTQQMQNGGSYSSTVFAGSESNNHYQVTGNSQWIRGYVENKKQGEISPPSVSPSPPRSTGRHLVSEASNENSQDSDYDTTVPSSNTDHSRGGEEEEPIVFPATTNPSQKPYYKVPAHPWEDTDLSSLKNILELRNGDGSSTDIPQQKKDEGNSRGTNSSKDKFSPITDGASEPSCAKHLGYCDINNFQDSYPKELINSVLTNSISSDLFKRVFGDVTDGTASKSNDFILVGRNNIAMTQETPMCSSQEITIYPRAAKNKDDKWMFIVNHDDYVQGVKVEKCMSEGSSCLFGEGNPLGYESVCRQKFILRKLVALNDDGKTSLDTFKLPSCCVCYIKSNFISDRTGVISGGASRNPPVFSDKGAGNSGSREGGAGSSLHEGPPLNLHDNGTECATQKKQLIVDPPPLPPLNRSTTSLLPNNNHSHTNLTTLTFS